MSCRKKYNPMETLQYRVQPAWLSLALILLLLLQVQCGQRCNLPGWGSIFHHCSRWSKRGKAKNWTTGHFWNKLQLKPIPWFQNWGTEDASAIQMRWWHSPKIIINVSFYSFFWIDQISERVHVQCVQEIRRVSYSFLGGNCSCSCSRQDVPTPAPPPRPCQGTWRGWGWTFQEQPKRRVWVSPASYPTSRIIAQPTILCRRPHPGK